MADPTQLDWTEKALELAQWTAGLIVTAASAVVLWFGRQAHLHIRKLNRHEERLDEAEKELGLNREHRTTCGKAPMGDALAIELRRLSSEDELLHGRINKQARIQNKHNARVNEKLGRIETNIEWLCREMGRDDCNTG